jgi:hypothetical protein
VLLPYLKILVYVNESQEIPIVKKRIKDMVVDDGLVVTTTITITKLLTSIQKVLHALPMKEAWLGYGLTKIKQQSAVVAWMPWPRRMS